MSIDIQPEPKAVPADRPLPQRPTAPSSRKPTKTGSWWKRALLAAVVLGVVGTGAAALVRRVAPSNGAKMLTHTIARGDLVVSVTEEGTLESSSNKEIKCKVKGGSTVLWVIESGTEVNLGDELVRLDQSTIEDNISQQKIVYETALANKKTSENDVAVAAINITEYLEGTFQSSKITMEKDVVIAESALKSAQNVLEYSKKMFGKGYISALELEAQEDAVKHAELELKVKQTDLNGLERFTKAKELQNLSSLLEVANAILASNTASLELEQARLEREKKQLENCVIRAEVAGMVIYPSAAEWKREPDIEEGAAVREDQVLLIMPDLNEMQVKVGIHEAKVDRVKPGTQARIELQDATIDGEVLSVASIAKPAGWWTGNVVKYDTIIKVDSQPGLKPGMSATVELFLAEHKDVLTIPVAAVLEQVDGFYCWVKTGEDTQRRPLELGDSNDQFIVVNGGLKEGDEVVLNPLAYIDDAQVEALKPRQEENADESKKGPPAPSGGIAKEAPKVETGGKPQRSGSKSDEQQAMKAIVQKVLKDGDKNNDGVLTKDEFDEKSKPFFEATDTDSNGKVDAAELAAGLKRMRQAAESQR